MLYSGRDRPGNPVPLLAGSPGERKSESFDFYPKLIPGPRFALLANDPAFAAGSLAKVLLVRSAQTPDAPAYYFLIDGQEEGPRLTYGDLDREARTIAAALRDVAGPGDRALLLYAPGLAFISAFFGCQYAGIVPVPTYPPRPDRLAPGWNWR